MGSAKAHYEGIKAFSETDQTDDLKQIGVPTLVLHGDDDQIVPIVASANKAVKLLKERDAEGLRGSSARHAHHPCRCSEPRSARLRARITDRIHKQRARQAMTTRRRVVKGLGAAAAAAFAPTGKEQRQ